MSAFSEQTLHSFQFIAAGIVVTLKYAFIASLGGSFIGLCLALLRMSSCKMAQRFSAFYTSVFRGTPLLVQLSLVYFGTPSLLSYQISPMLAGLVTFSLNSAAYVSENIRAGIKSVDRGQFEAARALGIPYFLMMKDIIFPQAIRNILPSLVNEAIDLIKETALISIIGEEDIMRRAQLIAAEKYTYFEPLMLAALCYYVIILFLSALAKKLEKRLSYDHH